MRTELVDEAVEVYCRATFNIEVNAAAEFSFASRSIIRAAAYPSRTAFPKGRVELEPPRKVFQMVSAKVLAWEAEVKPAAPVAPPRLMVTILPLDWQVWIAEARKEQFGS